MIGKPIRGCDGFTLVEVLVALAVSGLVVTAATGLTWTVRTFEGRAEVQRNARENVIAADRLLRAVVGGAAPDLASDRIDAQVGDGSLATFVTTGPPILAFDRPRPMTLAIETNHAAARLLLRWRDPEAPDREHSEEIVSGARAMTLSYFGPFNSGSGWQATWSQPSYLPAAVLLRIDMPELGAPIDLIARTYSRLPNACAMMPHEPRCSDDGVVTQIAR